MFKILVAIDGSAHSDKVVEDAARIAGPLQAEVTVLTVEDWNEVEKKDVSVSQEIVNNAAKHFREKNISVETRIERGIKRPADVICEVAKEEKYDLVILGSRGLRGVKELFLGSVSHRVAHLIETNFLVVK